MRVSPALIIVSAFSLAIPFSTPAQDQARIYVYAQRQTHAGAWLPITCDGAVVAEIKQGRLFAVSVPPGRHSVGTEKGVPASVDARPGQDSFVRLDWDLASDRPAIPVLTVVPSERAAKETKFLSYIDHGKVLSSSVARTDPRDLTQTRFKSRDGK